MERRLITWVIAVLIIMALVVSLSYTIDKSTGNAVKTQKETIKIGAVLPLSGPGGFIGQGMKDAILLAKEQLGNTKYNYEVVFEDDKIDPKESATAANKLISIDNVDALISATSGPGNAISPISQSNEVLHVGIASDANIAKGEYNFLHWTSPQEENRVFVQELKNRGIKKVVVIEMNQQGVRSIMDDLENKLKGTDIKISRYSFDLGSKDFKTILMKSKGFNADIYLLESFSPELELIAKQMRELGIKTPVSAIESIEFTEQPDLFEGSWYVQAADPTSEFSDEFREKYEKDPTLASPNAYDAFNLVVAAYEKAYKPESKPTSKEAASSLFQIKEFDGALGKLKMQDSRIIDSQAVVRQIINGKPVTISASKLN